MLFTENSQREIKGPQFRATHQLTPAHRLKLSILSCVCMACKLGVVLTFLNIEGKGKEREQEKRREERKKNL